MKTLLKRMVSAFFVTFIALSIIPVPAHADVVDGSGAVKEGSLDVSLPSGITSHSDTMVESSMEARGIDPLLAQADWRSTLTNNYTRAKQLAGRSTFNGYCSMAVSYELWAYGITSSREALGNGVDAASHFASQSTTSGGYRVTYTAGSRSGGWSAVDSATNNGGINGIYVISYTSNSSVYGHVSFLVIEGGTVYVTESYAYSGIPEGQCIVLSYANFKSQWARYYPNVTGAVRFGDSPPIPHYPSGWVDEVASGEGRIYVRGWAYDPDTPSSSIDVHVYVGGAAGYGGTFVGSVRANLSRPDVNSARGISGAHGFAMWLPTSLRGSQSFVIYAIDSAGGQNVSIGNGTTSIPSIVPPQGSISVTAGRYALRSALDTSKTLNVNFASRENAGEVVINTWAGSDNEKWTVSAAGDSSYHITAVHSGMNLDVLGGSFDNGGAIVQGTNNGHDNQRWFFVNNADGTVCVRSVWSRLDLDVYAASNVDGTRVVQWTQAGNPNQHWYLVPLDVSQWSVSVGDIALGTDGVAEPIPTLRAGGWTPQAGVDYDIAYLNNQSAGTGTVTVTGKNGHFGTKSTTFNISVAGQQMHRLYNPNSGEHFYTGNTAERDHLVSLGWRYEGVGWTAPVSGNPVFRLYNPNAGDHHYTVDAGERDFLFSVGWNDEGVGWRSAPSSGTPLHRLYNPNATGAGAHHYTTDTAERDYLVSLGWRYEGVGWWGVVGG